MSSLVQILAALLVLTAFALAQARVLTTQARVYLLLNAAGASVLAVDAYAHGQWGFLLLEAVWAAISAWALARSARESSVRRARRA
jgi:hypothetical protein